MAICEDAPTISTLFQAWTTEGRFAGQFQWTKRERVPVTTLDNLIASYGMPKFCKIDVEGFEKQALDGLSKPIPFISFEFCAEFLAIAKCCGERLLSIGAYEFQISLGESMDFALPHWVDSASLYEKLDSYSQSSHWGDVYARHSSARALWSQSD
jgi:hypothetical protein